CNDSFLVFVELGEELWQVSLPSALLHLNRPAIGPALNIHIRSVRPVEVLLDQRSRNLLRIALLGHPAVEVAIDVYRQRSLFIDLRLRLSLLRLHGLCTPGLLALG